MSHLGFLENGSLESEPNIFATDELGFGISSLKISSHTIAEEVLHLQSQRSQLEQANMLLRCQLENARLAQENQLLQKQLHLQRMQSWAQNTGGNPVRHVLEASVATGSQRKVLGGARAHATKDLRRTDEPTLLSSIAFSEQSTLEPSSLPVSFTNSEVGCFTGDTDPAGHEPTTCMMRNMPEDYTRQNLLDLVDAVGFAGKYNLVYLPMDFKSKTNLGYAFVDLISGDVAHKFLEAFTGYSDRGFSIEKECEVCWSTVQGYPAHIERYRNSPVMHPAVPDDFKPLLFVDGQRVPFPEPTKRIREPRNWKRAQERV
jgi:hypothetical protein